jgi:hypothetical protein
MATMINSAVRIPPQKQRCQHPLAGDDALTTTAAKGRDDATLMTTAVPASLDEGGDGDQHNNQHQNSRSSGRPEFSEKEKNGGRGPTGPPT